VPPVFDGALVTWEFAPTALDVPGNLLAYFNMVTIPLYHAFKCMLEQEGPSLPVPTVLQTAWTPVLHY
jgi:hypothetical protein